MVGKMLCQGGCGAAASDFQCPLCQAEGSTEAGFFCSQTCFASSWLKHRDTMHKSGMVREKVKAVVPKDATPVKKTKKELKEEAKQKKRQREEEESGDEEVRGASTDAASVVHVKPNTHHPWPPLPSAAACKTKKEAQVTPALALDVPRAVIGASSLNQQWHEEESKKESAQTVTPTAYSFWPACVAAAQYISASLTASEELHVLVAAGSAQSAHAFAWAMRCSAGNAATSAGMRLVVDASEVPEEPSSLYTARRRLLIATSDVVRSVGSKVANAADTTGESGAAALWLVKPCGLLVSLPDVPEAGDLQGVSTRALFFVNRLSGAAAKRQKKAASSSPKKSRSPSKKEASLSQQEAEAAAAAVSDDASAWAAEEDIAYEVSPLTSTGKEDKSSPLVWRPMPLHVYVAPPLPYRLVCSSTDEEGEEAPAAAEAEEIEGAREENRVVLGAGRMLTARMDNDVSTCLASGDVPGALQHLVRVYSSTPGFFEEVLFNSLCCDWAALSAVHQHHRLALVARYLVDHSDRFKAARGGTLADMALRAVAAVCRLVPSLPRVAFPLTAAAVSSSNEEPHRKKHKKQQAAAATEAVTSGAIVTPALCVEMLAAQPGIASPSAEEVRRYPNYFSCVATLQLQATLCYLYDMCPPALMDVLAAAWGITRCVPGVSALQAATRKRQQRADAMLRVQSRFRAKVDLSFANYLVVLAHFLYDAVAVYSLSVEELERRLMWNVTLARDVGDLASFLTMAGLLPDAKQEQQTKKNRGGKEEEKDNAIKALSSRKTGKERVPQRSDLLRCLAVKVPNPAEGYAVLPFEDFPLTERRGKEIAKLHKAALEEVLMAMPRVPRPMYIGDVGNLIGKWFRFNARFGGVLGVTLSDFMLKHPEAFQVVGKLVTRKTAGKSEQVRLRFDDDAQDTDSDDENSGRRKARDREMLTGAKARKAKMEQREKDMPSRARKKKAVKDFNKSRFNRNYKPIDPSAKVPGYVKRGPRKIKGRGKKANKRNTKRG